MKDSSAIDIYSRAMREARAELEGLRADFERISKRKAQLEAAIANLEPLVPITESDNALIPFPATSPSEYQPQRNSSQPPLWKSIRLSINGKSQSFTVRDALDALERIGKPVKSPNAFQIVRKALTTRDEVFEKIGTGIYRVREIESGRQEESPSLLN